jgi:hypothetical protein
MCRVYSEASGERSSKRPVGSYQRPKSLVDLPVHALPALLNSQHDHKANAHTHEGHECEPTDGQHYSLPRAKVHEPQCYLRVGAPNCVTGLSEKHVTLAVPFASTFTGRACLGYTLMSALGQPLKG